MPRPQKQTPTRKRVTKKDNVLDRISDIHFDENDGIKINVYGQSGTGKTTFWSSFPGNILAIICSGGNKPGELRSIPLDTRKKIKTVSIEKSTEVRELITYQKEENPFNTIVLDHATGFQELILKEILGIDELPAQLGWGVAKQQDWGQCALQVKNILRELLSLECNVVVVAQEREFTPSEGSELLMPHVGSALTPSISGWLLPACDYVVQTFKRQEVLTKKTTIGKKIVTTKSKGDRVEYCLRTAPHEMYMTKFRVPKGQELPQEIVDPDYTKLMSVIHGG